MQAENTLGPLAFVILSGLLNCGGGAGMPSSGTSAPGDGVWAAKAPLPTARQEMPSALVAGRIYTPGGYDAKGQTVAVLEVYDVAADRWSSGPALPEGRNHPGVAAAGGMVFVIGGYAPNGNGSATVFAFDPVAQRWTTRRPMPDTRAAHVSVELGGKIYSIGGVRGGAAVGTNEVYDPATDA